MTSEELNIRQLKLVSGDDIIALVHKKDNLMVAIERPMKIIHNLFGGYQLVPWFVFSNQTLFTLDPRQVLQHCEVSNDFKETYIKVSTEVVAPPLRSDKLFPDEIHPDLMEELEASERLDEFDDYVQDNVGKKDRILH